MVRHWVSWLSILFSLVLPCIGFADDNAPLPVPESVRHNHATEGILSASRIPGVALDPSRIAANVTVITAEELTQSGASNLPQALARAEGVTVADQQGFGIGADGTVNLRGIINSARTNAIVLVDGVRQNRVTGDEVHWQSIPVNQVERVEIIHGGAGTIYGEGALSGVINIITKHDSDKLIEAEEGTEVGSFGWQRYRSSARGKVKRFRYGVDYTRDLLTGYRESSKSRNTIVSTHAGVDITPQLAADVHIHHSDDTTFFPGLLTKNQTQTRRIQTNSFHGINTNELDQVSLDLTAGPWDGWTSLVTLYWKRWIQSSQDSVNFNLFTNTPSHGINLRSNHQWQSGSVENSFTNGLELFDEKATTGDPDAFAGADSESNRFGYGLYAEDTITFYDRVSLIAGMRYDRSRCSESLSFPAFEGTLRFQGFSPKLGITVSAIPDTLEFFTSFARPFKAPNIDDLSARLSSSGILTFVGNVDLKPQQGNTYELGSRFTAGALKSTATAFYTLIDREILLNSVASPFSTNQNFDTRRLGLELSNAATWEHARIHLNYMFVDAAFREGQFVDNSIPGTPKHSLHSGAGVSPLKGLWLDLDWEVINDFYRNNDIRNDLGKADNYGVLNVLCSYELPRPESASALWPKTTAYLRIDNITNEEYAAYQSSNGTSIAAGEAPSLPRTFFGGVRLEF